jgi:hypothetical protein
MPGPQSGVGERARDEKRVVGRVSRWAWEIADERGDQRFGTLAQTIPIRWS